jgi:hypothetical protein
MASLSAQRTLVKSPPELWSELSEVDRLAQHLEAFGEIRITKLEPEHTVAWEGEHACGTVSLEPSGWGTKVTFEAALAVEPEPEPEPQPEPQPEPVAVEPEREPEPVEDEHAPRRGFWARLFRSWLVPEERANRLAREPAEEPVAEEPVAPEPVPAEPPPPATTIEPRTAQAVLDHTLDTLGSAHHRPFSRS